MESLSSYLHFVLIIQPVLFAVQLFTYRGMFSRPHRVLGYYMALITLYFFVNANFLTGPLGIEGFTHVLIVPLFISLNPFYYLYVKTLTSENFRMTARQWLHFLPALTMLLFAIIGTIWNMAPELTKEQTEAGIQSFPDLIWYYTGLSSIYIAISVYYLQFIVYTILMVIMLIRHKRKLAHYFSYTENISLNWLWVFMVIYAVFSLFDAIVYFTPIFNSTKEIYFMIMILFINFLGYFGIKQTDIYLVKLRKATLPIANEEPIMIESVKDESVDLSVENDMNHEEKYSGSSLSDEQKNQLLQNLLELMKNPELFSDPDLTISDVASQLNTNYKYISQVINEKLSRNFYNFVNEYRVNAALEMMRKPEYQKLSLEGIAGMVGFRSRSAFNNAFKKVTGFPPSHFLKEQIH